MPPGFRSDFVTCASSTHYGVAIYVVFMSYAFSARTVSCVPDVATRYPNSSSTSGSDVATRRPMSPFRTPLLAVRCFHFRFTSLPWTATSTHELYHSFGLRLQLPSSPVDASASTTSHSVLFLYYCIVYLLVDIFRIEHLKLH